MKARYLRGLTVAALTLVLLGGCFAKESLEITNEAALQPTTEIQTLTGTPAEKVEGYTQKAQEAQAKLQILLQQQEAQKSSFLRFQFAPTTFAEEVAIEDAAVTTDDVAAEIEALLAEIQTYTELAAEAATEETNPEVAAELLATVQEAQVETEEIVSSATTEVTAEVAAVLADAAEEISSSIAEVDDATAEAADAIEAGVASIQLDIETDVEDLLAEGVAKIDLREKVGPQVRAERKLRNAIREMERVREKLISNGVPAEEADAVMAEKQAQVAEAQKLFDAGNFDEANQLAKDGKKGFKEIQVLANRAKDAKERMPELKALAEAGDPVAIAQLEKLAPLVEAGKDLKELLQQRKEIQTEYRAEAEELRAETKEERKAAREALAEFKLQEAVGEISTEEFQAQKEKFFIQQQEIRATRFEGEKSLREEKNAQLEELKGLPEEEIKAKLNEFQEQQKVQRKNIIQDTQKLQEALREGNAETIQAVKREIQATREEAKTQIDAQKEEVKNQMQETKKVIREAQDVGKEAAKAGIQEAKEAVKEVKKEIKEINAGVKEEVKQIKEDAKVQIQQRIEERKEIREEAKKPNVEVSPEQKETREENRGEGLAQPPLPPKMPALDNSNIPNNPDAPRPGLQR